MSLFFSKKLFETFQNDRIFEEFDEMLIEEKMIEINVAGTSKSSNFVKCSVFSLIPVIGSTICYGFRRKIIENMKLITGLSCCIGGVALFGGWGIQKWFWRKIGNIRKVIDEMENVKKLLKKRKQLSFCVSFQLNRNNPIMIKCCRVAAENIRFLNEETQKLQKQFGENSDHLWSEMWTKELIEIMQTDEQNNHELLIEKLENVDYETVFETFISVSRLHLSEFCRFLIYRLLKSSNFADFSTSIWYLLQISSKFQNYSLQFQELKKISIGRRKTENEYKIENKRRNVDLSLKNQLVIALDSIIEGIENETLKDSQIELSLKKCLNMLIIPVKNKMENENRNEINEINEENENGIKNEMKIKLEKTDIDMVFEGETLSENEKKNDKKCVDRDFLLDGCDGKKYEANLFGELQMVLEPRRNAFLKREKVALAKWYGIDEKELEAKDEQNFEAVGECQEEISEQEPYDWKKEAEETFGIHQNSNDFDFLNALSSRQVDDNIIES